MRCQWITEPDGSKWRLPGCMGAAMFGDHGCTCYKPKLKIKEGSEVSELRQENGMLRTITKQQGLAISKLQERIKQLERMGLPLELRRAIDAGDENKCAAFLWRMRQKNIQ